MERTASLAASDLIEQLMPLRSDPAKLNEALASCDTALVGAAFAQLLAIAAIDEEHTEKCRTLAPIDMSLPGEAFADVLLFADRDTLDSMVLASRFILDCIRRLQAQQLALRTLHEVCICFYWGDDTEHMMYNLSISREPRGSETNTGMSMDFDPMLAAPCFRLLNCFVRHAFCKNVRIAFSGPAQLTEERLRVERDGLFANLIAHETHVDALSIECSTEEIADLVGRSVQSFKSVTTIALDDVDLGQGRPEAFTEEFFVSLARKGVRPSTSKCPESISTLRRHSRLDLSSPQAVAGAY